jgi:mxaD protein
MTIRKLLFGLCALLLVSGQSAVAGGKLSVAKEAEINAGAADLWKLVGAFGGMQNWHPAVKSSEMTGDGMKAGDQRVLTLGDGAKINETLEAWDGAKMTLTYIITESPLPVTGYRSTITVTAAGDGKAKFSWTSTFDPKEGAADADAVNAITGVYDGGIAALKEKFK